jgi:predicted nuclease with TOPRIM domain
MTIFRLAPLLLLCAAAMPAAAQQNTQLAKANAQITALQKQVKALTEERDALQIKVDEMPNASRQEHAELFRQLDEAKAQKEQAEARLEQVEASLRENQSGGESILKELQQVRGELRNSNNKVEALEKELDDAKSRLDDAATVKDGAFVHLGPDVVPAKCLNLQRMTPSVRKVSGAVVVNCLINEMGDPIDIHLIQGLPGDSEWVRKANEACLEAAKRLVFHPATNKDGVRLKVWQGVAFFLK